MTPEKERDRPGQTQREHRGKPGMYQGKSPQRVHHESGGHTGMKPQENRNVDVDETDDKPGRKNTPKADHPRG